MSQETERGRTTIGADGHEGIRRSAGRGLLRIDPSAIMAVLCAPRQGHLERSCGSAFSSPATSMLSSRRSGVATLELLERLGCEVDYPFDQTCCGPADGQQWLPGRGGGDGATLCREFRRLRVRGVSVGQLRQPRSLQIRRDRADAGRARGAGRDLRARRVPARHSQGRGVSLGGLSAQGRAAQRLRLAARARPRQRLGAQRAFLLQAARSARQGSRASSSCSRRGPTNAAASAAPSRSSRRPSR